MCREFSLVSLVAVFLLWDSFVALGSTRISSPWQCKLRILERLQILLSELAAFLCFLVFFLLLLSLFVGLWRLFCCFRFDGNFVAMAVLGCNSGNFAFWIGCFASFEALVCSRMRRFSQYFRCGVISFFIAVLCTVLLTNKLELNFDSMRIF